MSAVTYAGSNSSTCIAPQEAKTLLGAKRAAKKLLYGALQGEGVVRIMVDAEVVWACERGLRTNYYLRSSRQGAVDEKK